jgi:hypothetical protein
VGVGHCDEYGRPVPPPTLREKLGTVVFAVAFIGVFLLLGIAMASCADSNSNAKVVGPSPGQVSEGIAGGFSQSTIDTAVGYMRTHVMKTSRTHGILLRVNRSEKSWAGVLVLPNGHVQVWQVLDSDKVPQANLLFDPGDYIALVEDHGWGTPALKPQKTSILHKHAVDLPPL